MICLLSEIHYKVIQDQILYHNWNFALLVWNNQIKWKKGHAELPRCEYVTNEDIMLATLLVWVITQSGSSVLSCLTLSLSVVCGLPHCCVIYCDELELKQVRRSSSCQLKGILKSQSYLDKHQKTLMYLSGISSMIIKVRSQISLCQGLYFCVAYADWL